MLSSQSNFFKALQAIVPTTFHISRLLLHQLVDDFSSLPLHLQPLNHPFLNPHLATCWTGLLSGNVPNLSGDTLFEGRGWHRANAYRWLDAFDSCLPLACAAIMLATGGASHSILRHQQYSGPSRTVFLLKDGRLCFTNPLSSGRKENARLDLLTMPPELSQYLLLFIVILLPVAIDLRKQMGQVHPYGSTHLFIVYHKRSRGTHPWLIDENYANKELRALTQKILSYSLDGRALTHLVFPILRQNFPQLFITNDSDFKSPVDDLAQHLYSTGITNYGRDINFPKTPYLVGNKPRRHMTICEIWQTAVAGMQPKDSWRALMQNSSFFSQIDLSSAKAFCTAQAQIAKLYLIKSPLTAAKRKHANHLLEESLPFLQGITVRPTARAVSAEC